MMTNQPVPVDDKTAEQRVDDGVSYQRIEQVAARTGLTKRTLRYYEEIGLLPPPTRTEGGYRLYSEADVQQLERIKRLKDLLGFSLAEIARMFSPNGRPRIDRKMLAQKARDLDGTIRKLIAMRNGLRHAAVCPAPSHMECPTFRRLVRAAAHGVIGAAGESARPPRPRRVSRRRATG